MKYNQPYGLTDPNAPYINGNPSTGTMGSIPPAASIEYPQREIVNAITANGLTPDNADLFQLTRAMRRQATNFLIDSGGQNAMVVAPSPALESLTPGLPLRVKVLHGNLNDMTYTNLTLDAGLGAVAVRMPDGTLPPANGLPAGGIATLVFDGTHWQLTGTGVGGGSGTVNVTSGIPYCLDTGPSSNNITAIFSPAITAIGAGGLTIEVKLAHALVNGVCNIWINALAPVRVKHTDGTDPAAGDGIVGQVLLLVYDGTAFQLIGIVGNPATRPSLLMAVPAPGGQYIPINTMTQVTSLSFLVLNTLVTSTWTVNGALTIGAGEDGLWSFHWFVGFSHDITPQAVFVHSKRARSGQPDLWYMVGYSALAGAGLGDIGSFSAGHVELAVGDVVTFYTSIWGSGGPYQINQSGPGSGYTVLPNLTAHRINRP